MDESIEKTILGKWGSVGSDVLRDLIERFRDRMDGGQKAHLVEALHEENETQIQNGGGRQPCSSKVSQALDIFLGKTPPMDPNGRYHPFGAVKHRRRRDLTEEQIEFLTTLSSMEGLFLDPMYLQYHLHGHGLPTTSMKLKQWLNKK